jgi:hypothetical protein
MFRSPTTTVERFVFSVRRFLWHQAALARSAPESHNEAWWLGQKSRATTASAADARHGRGPVSPAAKLRPVDRRDRGGGGARTLTGGVLSALPLPIGLHPRSMLHLGRPRPVLLTAGTSRLCLSGGRPSGTPVPFVGEALGLRSAREGAVGRRETRWAAPEDSGDAGDQSGQWLRRAGHRSGFRLSGAQISRRPP